MTIETSADTGGGKVDKLKSKLGVDNAKAEDTTVTPDPGGNKGPGEEPGSDAKAAPASSEDQGEPAGQASPDTGSNRSDDRGNQEEGETVEEVEIDDISLYEDKKMPYVSLMLVMVKMKKYENSMHHIAEGELLPEGWWKTRSNDNARKAVDLLVSLRTKPVS